MPTHSTVRFATSTLLTGVFAVFLSSALAAPLPVETEPTLNTSDFRGLPPLTGAGYRIEPTVPVSGYYGHFTLKTDLGTLDAEGIQLLHQRVNEVKAPTRSRRCRPPTCSSARSRNPRRRARSRSEGQSVILSIP